MGEASGNAMMGIVLGCAALSIILFALGLWLRRRGALASRGALIGWIVLMLTPLFGGGLFMFTKHQVERATGETQAGVNEPAGKAAQP